MNKTQKIRKYFNQKEKLTLKNKVYFNQVKRYLTNCLTDDLGNKGDVTSDALIKNSQKAEAIIVAKQDGIVAGLEEVTWLIKGYRLQVIGYRKDGDKIKRGNKILKLTGHIKTILKLERAILNLLQRMSGIATETARLTKLCPNVLVCSTRKTPLGLLDKKAVIVGNGGTHRLGLYDWILVKDNHIKCANYEMSTKLPARHASTAVVAGGRTTKFWEIEVTSDVEFKKALNWKPDAIMLDNFKPKDVKNILNRYSEDIKNIIIEASGGISEKNIVEYAKTGVDVISLGALTHSAKALDISLDIL